MEGGYGVVSAELPVSARRRKKWAWKWKERRKKRKGNNKRSQSTLHAAASMRPAPDWSRWTACSASKWQPTAKRFHSNPPNWDGRRVIKSFCAAAQ
ncbi:hypothetical protein GGTG_02750 [Gaeumannomyces tritici R3-111a-1]|uniref:Uncharacterized protein n=1 Tax=Gaeumannomyces tritici (strain R3-111a-1) TaxID=644352 RepID=J3NN93_GAET3|nr:hypothetical protein GGTG_02750 [Gaeumannomyces tritici R3-111a-1]EJT77645.1 hypothetical protein GGTG_02750 [Gaeumannomyces tritici R3-111a-1]